MSARKVLSEPAHRVATRVIAEEEQRRPHLVVALSGAHAYGFPSPDSDLDLKAIHAAPTAALLGLEPPADTADRQEIVDGVEIDYTSNELRPALLGLLAGNGNYLERVLAARVVLASPRLPELVALVPGLLSRRYYRHYRGFAWSQRQAFTDAPAPTAKQLLYVLRTALTGVHLLRTGELRVDLTTTAPEYGFEDVDALIATKRAGERVVLDEPARQAWLPRLDGLFALLDQARAASPLPEVPTGVAEVDAWLQATRRAG
ncbi:MAG: nucleotidyltransferase domain-containing protein [Kofleriaceae bacterium]|nr:nucleotidyltransferase domain-containing protein [Kofleriaceae bacterium]